MANIPLANAQQNATQQWGNAGLIGGLQAAQYPSSVPYAPAPSWHDVVSLQQTVMQLQNQIFQLQERLNKIQDVKTWLTGPGDDKVAP
jgi:hypothetical protein